MGKVFKNLLKGFIADNWCTSCAFRSLDLFAASFNDPIFKICTDFFSESSGNFFNDTF